MRLHRPQTRPRRHRVARRLRQIAKDHRRSLAPDTPSVRCSKQRSSSPATSAHTALPPYIGTYSKLALPPQTMPRRSSRPMLSKRCAVPPSKRRAQAMPCASMAPPPMVPHTNPSAETNISVPALRGVESLLSATATSTNGSPTRQAPTICSAILRIFPTSRPYGRKRSTQMKDGLQHAAATAKPLSETSPQ